MITSDLTLIVKKISEAQGKAIKEAIESNNKAIREFKNQLPGLTTAYTFEFKSPTDMQNALAKTKQFPELFSYTKPPYLREVSDAINNRDFFKAYTLCVTLYEAYGKDILFRQFKDKSSLAQDITNKLGVRNVILTLFNHGFIKKEIRSQMLSVNDTRNDLAHRYFSSQISIELGNEMEQNGPKITKTLETLKRIHDKLPKE